MALERELETYNRELPHLIAEAQGKFALVFEDSVAGIFDTYADALNAGYQKFQLKPFMVKQIATDEQAHFFTRDLAACHR